MEKGKAHYPLPTVHALCKADPPKVDFTISAMRDATGLGFESPEAMIALVLELDRGDLYKSMTTHADSTVWQDVYKVNTTKGRVYLKLTVVVSEDRLKVVSFKEDTSPSK